MKDWTPPFPGLSPYGSQIQRVYTTLVPRVRVRPRLSVSPTVSVSAYQDSSRPPGPDSVRVCGWESGVPAGRDGADKSDSPVGLRVVGIHSETGKV